MGRVAEGGFECLALCARHTDAERDICAVDGVPGHDGVRREHLRDRAGRRVGVAAPHEVPYVLPDERRTIERLPGRAAVCADQAADPQLRPAEVTHDDRDDVRYLVALELRQDRPTGGVAGFIRIVGAGLSALRTEPPRETNMPRIVEFVADLCEEVLGLCNGAHRSEARDEARAFDRLGLEAERRSQSAVAGDGHL